MYVHLRSLLAFPLSFYVDEKDMNHQIIDVPVIQTDLEIKSVKVETGVDISMNALILAGITSNKGSIV
ncbi:transferase hexapeptide repeat containing protein [Kalymmatonema gypsitolerans NIES-4073]|nr:transferase hexapeptide repeat containing protein [Scytonema sp. NIES-4073]